MNSEPLKVFSGNSNPQLTSSILNYLNIEAGKATVGRFSDGEVFVTIDENVRGMHTYVVQSTCPPANENIMELLVIIDALKKIFCI